MATGLAVSDVVAVSVNLSPVAVPTRNFGALLIAGPSDVIDVGERIRPYTTLAAVATDFGTTAPEYLAADLFFSQSPQPSFCYIGRWAQAATAGVLHGAALSAAQQVMTAWTTVTSGSFSITIDGTVKTASTLNFSGATNLNGVAAILQTALVSANVTWNSTYNRFVVESKTTGISSSVSYASAAGSGVDISDKLGLTLLAGASVPVAGIVAETPVAAAAVFATQSNSWYGLLFAPALVSDISDAAYLAVAGFIEGSSPARVFGITTQDARTLDGTSSADLSSLLQIASYNRTFTHYSSNSLYATASFYGRAFTVDFGGSNTAITLKFKQEPGVAAELLPESQAAALIAKKCNVFVQYENGVSIIQNGTMASGQFFDTIMGSDAMANAVQTALFNLLYTSTTKIPQTDAGAHQLKTTAEAICSQYVVNGFLAPGVWTAGGFGQLNMGDTLPLGFYVFMPPVASQSAADRGARKAPPMQIAAKLAGAIHSANCIIAINP